MNDGNPRRPAEYLEGRVRALLDNAVDAHQKDLGVYESLKNLNEVVGTEYGGRVLYELLQNAHDAHRPGDKGRIAIRLVIRSDNDGELYIANGGNGFREKDVDAIMNLAKSAKEVGDGIGNKGLGFRSIEVLTDDVRIFSRRGEEESDKFNGYCFRFSSADEIETELRSYSNDATTRSVVAGMISRYLVPKPLTEQSEEVISYARSGYATVIVAPLRTTEAVKLAREQIQAVTDLDVPLLLFLDRIAEVRVDVEEPDGRPYRRRLQRSQKLLRAIPRFHGSAIYEVAVGKGHRFLMVRHEVDKERVREAVQNSIPSVPQLKRWLDWKGQPVVSVAVGLSKATVTNSRLYNFLPMGEEASAPLIGYLDAPFFTDIDRRNADLGLPLNETLMEAAAEACAAAALLIAKHESSITPQAVFDLFAWTGEQAGKLDDVLERFDGSLPNAPVIPVIAKRGRKEWASLSQVSIWPDRGFAVLKDRDVAKHVGARLASKDLDARRVDRLREVANRAHLPLTPSGGQLADWSEAFAGSLLARDSTPRTWSSFYDDLLQVFDAFDAAIGQLDGKEILLDRSGKLQPAGGDYQTAQARVYVRHDVPKGKRKKAGVPLPPATLTRRYRFLADRITLKHETLKSLVEANLVREYDPVEALAGLKSVLGKTANDNRWREALSWAFEVWRAASVGVDDQLHAAGLHVPTLSGWQPAGCALFSSSWTSTGRTLENYLMEAAEVSEDCRRACDLMLVGQQDWPVPIQDVKGHWKRFLDVIGVTDGLQPTPARITRSGSPRWWWRPVLRGGISAEGLDAAWCAEVKDVSFTYSNTEDYRMKGEAWRLPGQIEHEKLPESAKIALCTLVFEHLKAHRTHYFEFEVGRFDRHPKPSNLQVDQRKLPTPLATFLRAKSWIAASTRDGMAFRDPGGCWASQSRRDGPPRFIDRVPETVADFSQSGELVELAFGEDLGLRDWQCQKTAVARLRDLAGVAASLVSSERPTAQKEYRRAWQDVVKTGTSIPRDFELIVKRRDQLEILCGAPEAPPAVIIAENAQRFEARILSAAGQPVLDVGPTSTERIATLLQETGAFAPHRLDGMGVRLIVDGEPFVPRSSDAFLTSQGLDWLPEVIVIGHEVLGEQLERSVQSSRIEDRVRAIRVRRCDAMTLVVDDEEVSPSEHLEWYAFDDQTLPTLILTHSLSLDWMALAGPLSPELARLIDSRVTSPKQLLPRLALYRTSNALESPSDEALARVLDCDVQTIHDNRALLRTDREHILHLLVPVVAYYGDVELSQQLRRDVDQGGVQFDLPNWLQHHLNDIEYTPKRLIEACEQAANRTELRRNLKLNYKIFNGVLLELGESPLSNEAELRRLYGAHLARLHCTIIERLRRHHAADFQNGNDLSKYVERKSLDFLAFNTKWIEMLETLEMELVDEYISVRLAETLGEDVAVQLPSLDPLVDANRKLVREVATRALPVLQVWCRQNNKPLPDPWNQSEAQTVVRHLENKGLLDFEAVTTESIPALFRRASCWPTGMPETLNEKALRLDKDRIEEEVKRRGHERQKQEIARRSIRFAGHSLDTGTPMFAESLREIAEARLSMDQTWFERSRQQPRLVKFQNPEQVGSESSTGGKGSSTRQRNRRLSDAQRQAMGLASEWLAFQFLRRRHSDFVNEKCWISENRAQFLGGSKGDDTAGYDFLVKTRQAEFMYEVKSSLDDSAEFELTANELRVASGASKDGGRRYRILYVPFVFMPDKWCVLELPNPMGEATRNRFTTVGRGSVRLRFKRR